LHPQAQHTYFSGGRTSVWSDKRVRVEVDGRLESSDQI
jgi:hypothetical protein